MWEFISLGYLLESSHNHPAIQQWSEGGKQVLLHHRQDIIAVKDLCKSIDGCD